MLHNLGRLTRGLFVIFPIVDTVADQLAKASFLNEFVLLLGL